MALDRTKFQGYECIEVDRRKLVNAPYNPRQMTDKARAKLKQGIKRLRLLDPPVWNARTGNLVGGHQRMAILDALEGREDYTLTVAKVDLSDKEEREANVLLNNQEAAGDWDLAKLESLVGDKALDPEAMGFDLQDVYKMFGADPIMARSGAMDELAQKIREARTAFDMAASSAGTREQSEFYLVVVFRDEADASDFCALLGVEDNRYQDGRVFRELYQKKGSGE